MASCDAYSKYVVTLLHLLSDMKAFTGVAWMIFPVLWFPTLIIIIDQIMFISTASFVV